MNLMDDEDLKKSVIEQMMGELDDVTAGSLKRKSDAPVKGVEIAITVSPKSDEMADTDDDDDDDDDDNKMADEEKPEGNYISDLLKKLG